MNSPKTTGVLLDVSEYSVGFRTERGLAQVVDKVSFQLERGSTLGIVGESGSGKSVLNRSLMGLISSNRQVEEGSALFDGEELVGRDRQRLLGQPHRHDLPRPHDVAQSRYAYWSSAVRAAPASTWP